MASHMSGRFFIAGDPLQSPESLKSLYENGSPFLRRRLAENPSSPEELLLMLSRDPDPEVRSSLAGNKAVPLEILEALVSDENVDVRLSLAEECSLPPYLLKKLSEDSNPYVMDRAVSTLEAIAFENQLKNDGFIPQAGTSALLGELLLASGAIDSDMLLSSLAFARREELPLGRVLVKNNLLEPAFVIRALKLQSLIRTGKLSIESANEQLKRERC